MKKTSFLLATVALVCAMTTSCSKEENNQSGKDQFYATMENSKISLTGTGVTTWNAGDQIKVFGYDETDYNMPSFYELVDGAGTSNGVFECIPDPYDPLYYVPLDHGPYVAFYPGNYSVEFITQVGGYHGESIVTDVHMPDGWYYTSQPMPMFARSNTRQLTFSHMLSFLKLHIQSDITRRLGYIRVTADKSISGLLPVVYDADGNPYITPYDGGHEDAININPNRSLEICKPAFLMTVIRKSSSYIAV